MDGWMDGRTDGRTDGRMNEQKSRVFYRTLTPSGLLPCFPSLQFTIMQSRATAIADHILPLGDLLMYVHFFLYIDVNVLIGQHRVGVAMVMN